MRSASRLLLLFPLITCLSRQALARETADRSDPRDEAPFELVVRRANVAPNNVQIAPGASLPLEAQLTWSGKEPVTIYWGNLNADDWVRLTVKTPLETELVSSYNVSELKPERAGEKQIVTLGPGESVKGSIYPNSFSGGPHRFWFREPGPYELTASVEIHAATGDPSQPESWQSLGRVTASPVRFSVKYGDDPELDFRLVRGRVTDADGAPVRRADVYVHVERISFSSPLMTPRFTAYDRAVTDEDGRFAFPSIPGSEPRLMLGVVPLSLPPAEQTVAVDAASEVLDVDFQLSPGRTVTGTVVDAEGRPLSGVALSRPWLPWMRFSDAVVTGADGRFEIDGIPSDKTWISVAKRDWEVVDRSNALESGEGAASITIIMQPRQSPDQLTGVARFGNGEPAGDMDLTMWIERADGGPMERRGHTDGDGRFAVELPSEFVESAGPVTGLVELARPPAQEAGDRWMARFEVSPGEREVEFEFRREHSLTVHLRSAVPLPYELGVRVDLAGRPSHASRPIRSQTERGDELESLTWHDLTAGRYRISVQLEEASHYNWSEDVVIPFDDPTTEHEITFDIPEIHFGILRVKVQYPDGRKPANDETVWMDGTMAHGWQHIINGVATFPVVPVGPVTVSHSERNGIVGLPIRGRVEADGVTTLGPLILQRVEDAYGHVSGRVIMADGTPALGAAATLQHFVSSSVLSAEQSRVSGSGEFRVSGEPGARFLVVNLKGCDLWPPGSAAEKASTNSPFGLQAGGLESQALIRSLVRPVTLTAGEEQVMDVMLPDVSFRDVTVELPGEAGAHTTLWTDLGEMWMHMEGNVDRDGSHTFRHVPDLPTRLFVTAWDSTTPDHRRHHGSAVVRVPAGDAPVVRPDLSRTGRLLVRANVPEAAVERLSYRVRLVDDVLPARLATLVGIGNMVERYVDEDGFVTFRLAPGRYTVSARLDGAEQTRNVELERDMEREVEFDFTTATE